jgi:hypothetical protein
MDKEKVRKEARAGDTERSVERLGQSSLARVKAAA